ncbi:MAG: hypothetical protein OEO77_03935 [Acidimicrobiia bacterium]|nr:hypothetical protein [Acidimicrobiia bacterium]
MSDTIWFRSAAMGMGRWQADPDRKESLGLATSRLDRLAGKRPHRALLFIKFLYGTRIASLAYMAVRNVPTRTFVLFDAAGTTLWLAVMIPIGGGSDEGSMHWGRT